MVVFNNLLRQTEIENFDLPALVDDDVRRFYVAVYDALPVSFFQRACDLLYYLYGARNGKRALVQQIV